MLGKIVAYWKLTSRCTEYISQLESEIANRVTENSDLRAQNRALMEENKRLSDLTRMLLSSPSFSDLLNQISNNPAAFQQQIPQVQSSPAQQPEQVRQIPKDVNPYVGTQQTQQQRMGLTTIPEQSADISALSIENDAAAFNFQPQVFAVLETPEMPTIDTNLLCGKKSNFVGAQFGLEDDKVQVPVIDRPIVEKPLAPPPPQQTPPLDPEFESNPEFALYHSSPPGETHEMPSEPDEPWQVDIFGCVDPEKVLARYELVDASEEERSSLLAMAKVQRICERLETAWGTISKIIDGI